MRSTNLTSTLCPTPNTGAGDLGHQNGGVIMKYILHTSNSNVRVLMKTDHRCTQEEQRLTSARVKSQGKRALNTKTYQRSCQWLGTYCPCGCWATTLPRSWLPVRDDVMEHVGRNRGARPQIPHRASAPSTRAHHRFGLPMLSRLL